MPAVTAPLARSVSLARRATPWPAVLAWTLGFAVVAYLAFSNGGYDTVVRNQLGVALWWLVLVGAVVGVLPGRLPAGACVALGLLAAFVLWTALSTGWSESAERSWAEAGRVATYLSFLVLGLAAQRRAGARHLLNGVACAVALVGVLAVLSRLHPTWFPVNDQAAFLANSARLAYPLNYWNALAALFAMGVPLLLAMAAGARRIWVHALAASIVPILALGAWFTESRGGVISFSVAIVVWLALSHDRLARLANLLVAGVGAAILIAAADNRPILARGLRTHAAVVAGDRFIVVVVIVCAGVAALTTALTLLERHATRPRWLEPSPTRWLALAAATLLVAVGVAAAAGVPGRLHHAWEDFKAPPGLVADPAGATSPFARLQSASSHGRYQYWQAARQAQEAHPWKGIGAGTFEFWWIRHPTTNGYVHDAHSLYFQSLGELGIIGFVLIAGLLLTLLAMGIVRALRAPPELRTVLAGATATIAAFAATAAYEWVWQLAAMAAIVLLLGAVALAGRADLDVAAEARDALGPVTGRLRRSRASLGARPGRVVAAVLAMCCLPLVAIPLAGASDVRASNQAAADGRVARALQDARSAGRVQPYAATPHLQQALLLETDGDLGGALAQARQATTSEPTNWRTWLIRARIEAESGHATAAVTSFRRFRTLNPESTLLSLR